MTQGFKSKLLKTLAKIVGPASFLTALYIGLSPRFLPSLYEKKVFRPFRYPEGNWDCEQLAGVPRQDVYFAAVDGSRLHGWFFHQPASHFVVVFSHGNTGNLTGRIGLAELIVTSGASLLIYDYRGYGRSEGTPTLPGIIADCASAVDYLIRDRHYAPQQVVLYGESLGCSVSSEVAAVHPCAGVILQSGFTSLPDIGAVHLPLTRIFPRFLFPRPHLDNADLMSRYKRPLLLIHGHKDQVVPFDHARQIFDRAAEPKMFVELPDCAHTDIWQVAPETYIEAIKMFLSSLQSQ